MKNNFTTVIRTTLSEFSTRLVLAATILALGGCSDNTGSLGGTQAPTDPGAPAPVAVAGTLALGTDKNFILTDNASVATLTATLVDTSNALMPGATVTFATTTGNLSASSATTDENGQATVTLKSGLADYSNRTAVVTAATAAGQSASIPIDITGSTVTLAVTPGNTIQVGAGTLTVTATVENASGLGLANRTVRFSIGAASTGAGTLSTSTQTTDASGVTPQVTFTPTAAGTVALTAEWLGSTGTAVATATSNIEVTPAAGIAFAVTTPATDPAGLTASTIPVPSTQLITLTVPADIAGTAIANVRLSATSGALVGITQATASSSSILQTPASGAVAATYTAPVNSGSVTIQVDALDAAGAVVSTLSRTFVISAPASASAKLFMGATPSVVSPSSGGNTRTSTLKVTVRDANNNTVGGAAVQFGLLGTTGSGETVSPAVVITDAFGVATATFSAGTASTVGDIYAQAKIVGAPDCSFTAATTDPFGNPVVPDPKTETEPLCIAVPLKVASAAVNVTVGFGTVVTDEYDSTQYRLPGSVIVLDSNGGPVAGATVTLSAFPAYYRNGEIIVGRVQVGNSFELQCTGPHDTRTGFWDTNLNGVNYVGYTSFVAAEDTNRNGMLDPGEDTIGNGTIDIFGPNEDLNRNGKLDWIYEDINYNWVLDPGEDINGNGVLDYPAYSEDLNNNGVLDIGTEDANYNNVLDPGEDTPVSASAMAAQAVVLNGLLSPPHAAGGTVTPATVVTDANGAASFDLRYLKSHAWFIATEVTARVDVNGTESTAKFLQELLMSEPDIKSDICSLARRANY